MTNYIWLSAKKYNNNCQDFNETSFQCNSVEEVFWYINDINKKIDITATSVFYQTLKNCAIASCTYINNVCTCFIYEMK